MIGLNELFFLKSILASNFARLSFPFKISYALTYRCNLRCQMCNIWKKETGPRELSVSEIETFFKNTNKFSWIGITGGEPFLRGDISDICGIILNYCHNLCALHFSTNGQLTDKIIILAERIHKKYNKLKLVFTVSIDGPPDLHDQIRGVRGSWANAAQTFIQLKGLAYVKPQIGFTLSSYNIDKYAQTFSALEGVYPDIKFDDININVFQKSSFYYENQDMPEPETAALLKAIKEIRNIDLERFSLNNFLRREYLKRYPVYLKTKKHPLKCKALSSSCFLDPYGNLYPCPVYNKKLINVRDMGKNFTSVWDGREGRLLRKECANNSCPGCWSPCDAFSSIVGSLPRLFYKLNS